MMQAKALHAYTSTLIASRGQRQAVHNRQYGVVCQPHGLPATLKKSGLSSDQAQVKIG